MKPLIATSILMALLLADTIAVEPPPTPKKESSTTTNSGQWLTKMSPKTRASCGLDKLSPQELEALRKYVGGLISKKDKVVIAIKGENSLCLMVQELMEVGLTNEVEEGDEWIGRALAVGSFGKGNSSTSHWKYGSDIGSKTHWLLAQ